MIIRDIPVSRSELLETKAYPQRQALTAPPSPNIPAQAKIRRSTPSGRNSAGIKPAANKPEESNMRGLNRGLQQSMINSEPATWNTYVIVFPESPKKPVST